MIIWLNGAFGGGKTTTAAALRPLIPASRLFDPQTVLTREYLDQIFAGLRAAGLTVFHVVLDADESVLHRRIQGSGEAPEWRLANLPGYLTALSWMIPAADLVVDTAAVTPAGAARQIAGALPELPGAPSGTD